MEATMKDDLFDDELCGLVKFTDATTTAQQAFGGSVTAESVNLDNFVTRKEFDELKASIDSQPTPKKIKSNLTEDAKNE